MISDVSTLRVNERDNDISSSAGGWKTLMVMSQSSWVQEGPALPRSLNGTVIPDEPAATTLIVNSNLVECNVYSKSGSIMMWH